LQPKYLRQKILHRSSTSTPSPGPIALLCHLKHFTSNQTRAVITKIIVVNFTVRKSGFINKLLTTLKTIIMGMLFFQIMKNSIYQDHKKLQKKIYTIFTVQMITNNNYLASKLEPPDWQ
jgi:hypothetical protein